jgi:hypothetical protein
MAFQPQHARNCPALWRGFYTTLFDRVPEDAPCTCGAQAYPRSGEATPGAAGLAPVERAA